MKQRAPGAKTRWAARWGHLALPCLLGLGLLGAAGPLAAAPTLETANNLYFEGKFADAARAYESLLTNGTPSAGLYYNLGNAYFKAGQNGRAIAEYLRAMRLTPRDPNLRFNLRFVREKVTGSDGPVGKAWERALGALTLNEWALLAAAMFWAWFGLMMVRELRPAWRKPLRASLGLAAAATVAAAVALTAAWRLAQVNTAVVVQPEAVVRQGPLERSPIAFKLRDGIEVVVQDQQTIGELAQAQAWLQVRAAGGRVGWVKRDQVMLTH